MDATWKVLYQNGFKKKQHYKTIFPYEKNYLQTSTSTRTDISIMITLTRNSESCELNIETWSATINLGRNANENDLLFRTAKQMDMWFHLYNLPSAHAYLSINGNPSTSCLKSLMQECANLVRQYSKCAGNTKVNYLQRRFLSKGSKAGEVVLKKSPGCM